MKRFKGAIFGLASLFIVINAQNAWSQAAPLYSGLKLSQFVSAINGVPVVDDGNTIAPVGATVTFTSVVENVNPVGTLPTTNQVRLRELFSGPFNLIGSPGVPAGVTCDPYSTPAGTINVTESICRMGPIAPGGTVSITYTGTLVGEGQVDKIGDVNDFTLVGGFLVQIPDFFPIDNVATASIIAGDVAPPDGNLVTFKVADNLVPVVGTDTVTYGIAVSNLSTVPVSNVIVTDITFGNISMPTGLNVFGAWTCLGVFSLPGVVNNFQYCIFPGPVAAGGVTPPLFITGTPTAAGPIANIATATSGSITDVLPTDNAAVVTVVAVDAPPPSVDLSITKSVSDSNPQPGDTVTYTINVSKPGGSPTVSNVIVTDKISGPMNLNVGSLPVFCGAIASPDGNVDIIQCSGSLAPANLSFSYTATVPAAPAAFGQTDNIACISAASVTDPNQSNNCAVASTIVVDTSGPQTDLMLTKSVVTSLTPAVGDLVSYEFTVANLGSSPIAAGQAVVTDTTVGAINMTAVSADPGWTCSQPIVLPGANPPIPPGDPFRLVCTNVNPIPANTAQVFHVNGTVVVPGGPITNTATVVGTGLFDTNLSNNSESLTLIASAPTISADYTVRKEYTGTSAQVGDNAQFTVTVRNDSGATIPANALQITDISSGPIGTPLLVGSVQFSCASDVTNPKQIECTNNVPIVAGTEFNFTVSGPILSTGVTDQIDNFVSVSSTTVNDTNLSNNHASASVIRGGALVDLTVTKTASVGEIDVPAPSGPSAPVTFTVNFSVNNDVATNVQIRDLIQGPLSGLPTNINVTYSSALPPAPCGASQITANQLYQVICNFGSLPPGVGQLTYDVTLNAPGQVDNIATIADLDNSTTGEPRSTDYNLTNNSAIASVVGVDPGLPDGDLVITKTATPDSGQSGDLITYVLTVSTGSVGIPAGTEIDVTDLVTGDFTNLSFVSSTGGFVCADTATTVTCDLTTGAVIPPFTTIGTITATLNIGNTATTIVNTAGVSSADINDINESNNFAVAAVNGTVPQNESNLRVINGAVPGQIFVDGVNSSTFTVRVVNGDGAGGLDPVPVNRALLHNLITVPTTVTPADVVVTPDANSTCTAVTSPPVAGTLRVNCRNSTIMNTGDFFEVTIQVTPPSLPAGQGLAVISNSATVSPTNNANYIDPVLANNTATASFIATAFACGDGVLEGFEQCDDGNTTPGDGCSDTCQLEVTAVDLSITKSASVGQAEIGDTVDFTIVVTNNDQTNSTTNTTMTDILSGEVPLANLTNPQISCTTITPTPCNAFTSPATNTNVSTFSCDIGSMPPSEVCTITYTVTIEVNGQIDNIAAVDDLDFNDDGSITPATLDPNESNNASVASTIGVDQSLPSADLSISKVANTPNGTDIGDPVDFVVTVRNNGTDPVPAGSVIQVTDITSGPISAPVTFTQGAFSCGVDLINNKQVNCTLATGLGVNQAQSFTVSGTIQDDQQIDNVASVSSEDINDPNKSNNTAVASIIGTNPVLLSDLQIVKAADVNQAQVGTTVTYTVVVTNLASQAGAVTATNFRVSDTISGDFTLTSALPAGCSISGAVPVQIITCNGASLGVGISSVVTYSGTINAQGTVTNTASVSMTDTSSSIDPVGSNNTAAATVLATDQVCGDNIQEGLEQCDDGRQCEDLTTPCTTNLDCTGILGGTCATRDDDGCDANCNLETADLSVVKTVDVSQAPIVTTLDPTNVEFTIEVHNEGATATNVVVTDQLIAAPGTFTISAITPSLGSTICTPTSMVSPSVITCTIGSMDGDDDETITVTGWVTGLGQIDNTAVVSDTALGNVPPVPDGNLSNNTSVASVNGAQTPVNLSITKQALVNNVAVGQVNSDQDVTWRITVNNPFNAPITGVEIVDQMTAGFEFSSATFVSGSTGTCNPPNGTTPSTITCTPTTLAANSQTVIEIVGNASSTFEGQIDNTASVDFTNANFIDPNKANNTAVASVIVVQREADLEITKTVDNPQANEGEQVTFTVTVTNNDTVDAEGVVVTDQITGPINVTGGTFTSQCATIVPAVPAVAQPSLTAQCIPPSGTIVAGGGTFSFTMIGTVNAEGQIDNIASVDTTITTDPDQSNNSAVASVNGDLLADLSVTKTVVSGPGPYNINATVTFQVEICNAGPSIATNVTLTDMQLGGLSFDLPAPTGCTITGNNMVCDPIVASIAVDDCYSFQYDSTANEAGIWSNIVTVSSDVEDKQISNNTTSANVNVGVSNDADIEITKTADVTEIQQGGTVNYTMTVTNNGPNDASNVVVTDFVAGPYASINGFTVTPPLAATCAADQNGLITCNIPTLPEDVPFNTVTIEYSIVTQEAGTLSNLATVSAPNTDPDTTNNSAAWNVEVTPPAADLSITKGVAPNPVIQGNTVTWTLKVNNNGPDTAENVVVLDQISGNYENVTASASNGSSCNIQSTSDTTTSVTCNLGDIEEDDAEITITITATANGLAAVQSNTASVSSDTFDPVLNNNVTTADTISVIDDGDECTTQQCLQGSGLGEDGGCALNKGQSADSKAILGFLVLAAVALTVFRRSKASFRR